MARPRTPTYLLEQAGSFDHDPQRRAARENEPVPSGPLGDPPEAFTPYQREAWLELMLQVPDGVLTIADRVMVEMYCRLVARMRGELDAQGNPQSLRAAESSLLLTLLGRMGLTPADRSRINAPTKPQKHADDTFARLASTGRIKQPVEQ